MSVSWADVLDLYGRALVDFQNELGQAEMPTFEFRFPEGLGPLPEELAGPAIALADLAARVEDDVRAAMADIARDQIAVSRARMRATRARPRARFIDVES